MVWFLSMNFFLGLVGIEIWHEIFFVHFSTCVWHCWCIRGYLSFFFSNIYTELFSCSLFKQYLKIVRHLEGYGEVVFPHCSCDSRRDGHVIAMIGLQCFKLQACKEDGTPEVRHGDKWPAKSQTFRLKKVQGI